MKFFLITVAFFCFSYASAQSIKYNVIGIPDSLTKNANSILRQYEETFTVENAGKAIHKIHYVCTVLNKEGDSEGILSLHHDKLTKIESLTGNLYDANGVVITPLKKTHIQDQVNEADYEFTDGKQRIVRFDYGQYPYTVEFEYVLVNTNMMFYPVFQPQESSDMAVQQASLTVLLPATMKTLRYKEVNIKNKVSIGTQKDFTTYTWKLKGLPAHKHEPYSTPWNRACPIVYTAPSDFEVSGYKGNMSSWEELGKFQLLLNKDRDILPVATVAEVQKLVENLPTPYEKAKRIYEYLQSKTRYISIQLGIGGWQTLPAELVDKKGYGDCKALSNYTKAMLKAVGIESHYTIIRSGKNAPPITSDFSCNYFNHIILCVPMARDTVWLECTSQNQAFGFLGSFTSDRDCLLITPEGGKIARTPKYSQNLNGQTRHVTVKMLATGEASVEAVTTYTGLQMENDGLNHYIHESRETQKQWMIEKHLSMPQFDLVSFGFKENKAKTPQIVETLAVKLKSFGSKNGKRIFITPNLMNKSEMPFTEGEKRTKDIDLSFPAFTDSDTLRYELPEGYHVEGTPTETDLKTVFGTYKTIVKVEQGMITYIRQKSMQGGQYPREKYQELVEFYKNIVKADNTKIVLVKST